MTFAIFGRARNHGKKVPKIVKPPLAELPIAFIFSDDEQFVLELHKSSAIKRLP